MDDRRQGARIQTVFRSNLSSAEVSLGQGTVLDVSTSGCRARAEIPVQVNDSFRMQLFLPTLPWPIQIEQARVKWVNGQEFGCQFITILPEERSRLLEGLEELERGRRQ
jgi:PilZ domain